MGKLASKLLIYAQAISIKRRALIRRLYSKFK